MFFILCRLCSLLAHLETKYIIQECSEDCISVFIFHTQQTIENVANIQNLLAQIKTQGIITLTKGAQTIVLETDTVNGCHGRGACSVV